MAAVNGSSLRSSSFEILANGQTDLLSGTWSYCVGVVALSLNSNICETVAVKVNICDAYKSSVCLFSEFSHFVSSQIQNNKALRDLKGFLEITEIWLLHKLIDFKLCK